MKNILIKTVCILSLLSVLLFAYSCDLVNENLQENPKSFRSIENSYVTMQNFESALNEIYSRVRNLHYGPNFHPNHAHMYGSDIAFNGREDNRWFGNYSRTLQPTFGWISYHWNNHYKIIANANTIIDRLDDSELTDDQKVRVTAEAKFFRAFSYRYLVYLYGGVPLNLEEITTPRTDFTRATREEVLNQIVEDASEAAANLPDIDAVIDGKVSNLVAYHLLAETYISLGMFDEAIDAASEVVNHPSTFLMTERFGTRANEDPEDEFLKFETSGDVYWDLFRQGNQDRSSGNLEALWVAQMEVDVPGGLLTSTGYNNALERIVVPLAWILLDDPDGNPGMVGQPRSNYNGGGRGISNLRPTDWWTNDLWESDWDNDIRNAPHNIIRDVVYDNPESAYFGESALEYPSPTLENQEWRWYPYPSKVTTPGNHPDELFIDKSENDLMRSSAGSTYRERYYLRLAETYLLRAEAYLGKGDLASAANDINIVRERSNASPVEAGDVDIDYILDERARELIFEEQRRITLHRTGKLVERVRKFNDWNADQIQDFHELWPIPLSAIEANKDATLEQNPGYN